MRVVFFGMTGEFSRAALAALLEAGIDVRSVIVPVSRADAPIARLRPAASRSDVPIVDAYLEPSSLHLAWQSDIPVFEANRLDHPDTLALLSDVRPDLACVACFPKRIPPALLSLPRFGFLNLHPSRLPAYRGPEPLFWQFRNGETSIGVTLHFMDEGLDTGDIASQARLDLPDGISGAEANRLCAEAGGRLTVEAIHSLAAGRLARRKQSGTGSYFPSPSPDDFTLDVSWSARRAFNFMRGTAEWGQPYRLDVAGDRLLLKSALSFSASPVLDHPFVQVAGEAWIQFTPGSLRASRA